MNTEKLLAAIESESMPATDYNFRAKVIPVSQVIQLINEAMENQVISPIEPTDEILTELTNGDPGKNKVMRLRWKQALSTLSQDGDSHE